MSKLIQMASAAVFAAVAAASLYSLAVASPAEGGVEAKLERCEIAFCLVAFF